MILYRNIIQKHGVFVPQIIFKNKLKRIKNTDIIRLYKDGERNFREINAEEFDFTGLNLRGADFSNSNLRFTDWRDAKLEGCDFSGSDMEWSSFERADIGGAKFVGANIVKSILNKAIVDDKTDMTNADLSWCLIFDVSWGLVKSNGAQISTVAFSPAEITEEGIKFIHGEMSKLKNISFETQMYIGFSLSKTRTSAKNLVIRGSENATSYNTGVTEGYGNLQLGYGASEKRVGYGSSASYNAETNYRNRKTGKYKES